MTHPAIKFIFFLCVAIIGTFANFKLTKAPFVWTFSLWSIFFSAGAMLFSRPLIRLCCIYFVAIFLSFAILEFYWNESGENLEKVTITPGYHQKSDILGYGPTPGFTGKARKTYESETVYDVNYTINDDGLRKSSRSESIKILVGKPCLLFFGGSVTFGEGVNDEEAMPFRVGERAEGNYQVHNFGFHGYGPHQMLSAIENGMVDRIISCTPKFIFYQAIVAHIHRSAGLAHWDPHGPQYILKESGELKFSGNFDDDNFFPEFVNKQLNKSEIYKKLLGGQRALREDDIELYLSVVKTARNRFRGKYPDARFHILFWDTKAWSTEQEHLITRLKKGFRESEIKVHLLSKILPGFHKNLLIYELGPHDHHPNANTHDLIAKYIVENVLEEK